MAVNERLLDRLETARARAAVTGRPVAVTVAQPGRGVDPLGIALSGGPAAMSYWHQPDAGFTIGATGSVLDIVAAPEPGRFEWTAEQVRDLRARTIQVALDGAERAPLLVGGFSFFDAPEWRSFRPGRLVLPELAAIVREGATTIVGATLVAETTDTDVEAARLTQLLDTAAERIVDGEMGSADHEAAAAIDLRDPTYVKTVEAAIDEIAAGALQKIVVARELTVDHRPQLASFLLALGERYTTCATFAFGTDHGVFCGATPERLVKVDGVAVSTAAVAGTAPRGADATQDQVIADRLRHDPKELEEHGYVISEIRRRLAAGGCVLDPLAPTDVMRLPGIQHLVTPIGGTAPVGTDVLDLAGALHPTPAVAGLPVEEAKAWISAHEPLDRGWYAGPVGYCDLAGNGEFRVALRSALLEGSTSRLFAGAGIVGVSNAERELEETSLKLGALLPSLLGS